jgi:hypothetical protein
MIFQERAGYFVATNSTLNLRDAVNSYTGAMYVYMILHFKMKTCIKNPGNIGLLNLIPDIETGQLQEADN